MNTAQTEYLANLTNKSARALLNKFNYNPVTAFARGDDAYAAFQACWDVIFPGTYWQCQHRAKADGGVQFHYVDMTDINEAPALSPEYGR
jgi:hypothetical protein